VPHISLVFREMWETTNFNLFPDPRKRPMKLQNRLPEPVELGARMGG
jgi:hypothetical protein